MFAGAQRLRASTQNFYLSHFAAYLTHSRKKAGFLLRNRPFRRVVRQRLLLH